MLLSLYNIKANGIHQGAVEFRLYSSMLCYCCHGLFFLCNHIIIVVDAAEPLLMTNFKAERFLQIHFLCSFGKCFPKQAKSEEH